MKLFRGTLQLTLAVFGLQRPHPSATSALPTEQCLCGCGSVCCRFLSDLITCLRMLFSIRFHYSQSVLWLVWFLQSNLWDIFTELESSKTKSMLHRFSFLYCMQMMLALFTLCIMCSHKPISSQVCECWVLFSFFTRLNEVCGRVREALSYFMDILGH